MGYPLRYRNHSPQPVVRAPQRGPAQILRFPHRFRRGTFGPSTRLAGRTSFGLWRRQGLALAETAPALELGGSGALRLASRLAPWLAAAEIAFVLYNMLEGAAKGIATEAALSAFGYSKVQDCGIGYNGMYTAAQPSCGALQVDLDNMHLLSARPSNIYLWYDPHNPVLPNNHRVCLPSQHWQRAVSPGQDMRALQPLFMPSPALTIAGQTYARPLEEAVVVSVPLGVVPALLPSDLPYGSERGDENGPANFWARPEAEVFANPSGGNSVSVVRSTTSERPPGPRERERKLSSNSAAGRVVITAFRMFSTLGSVNSAVDAFWRAIPGNSQRGRVGILTKYRELWLNWRDIELNDAFANAFAFWVRYKLAGMFYGRAFRALQNRFGANTGAWLYRALATATSQAEHERIVRDLRRRQARSKRRRRRQ